MAIYQNERVMLESQSITGDISSTIINLDQFEQASITVKITNSSNIDGTMYFKVGNKTTDMEKWQDSFIPISGNDIHIFNITSPARYIQLSIELFTGSCTGEAYATLKA